MKVKDQTKNIVGIGLFTAIVIALQALAVVIRPTGLFSISLVLAPIIVGAAMYGKKAGAWLGFVFGVVVLITDAGAFLAVNIPGTIITCIAKGLLCGLAAAAVYRPLAKKSQLLGSIVAGIVAPLVNTGVFLIGCRLFFMSTINEWAAASGYPSAGKYMVVTLVGINFLIETGVNLVLSTTIVRLVSLGKKSNLATA